MTKNITDVLNTPPEVTPAPPAAEVFDFEKECRITSKTVLPEITPSIEIDGSWLCTDGGILVVSGQKKAGKSNAIVYIIATALMNEVDTNKTLLIRSKPQTLDIVYIDTEQSPTKTKEFIQRAKKLAGVESDPKNLRFYNIRKLDLEKRNAFLRWVLEKPEKIGLLVVDGVADFVPSINDEEKAKQLGDFLFSKIHDSMSLVTAIHEGKDGQGAMGHLGQYLEKKCSGTIALFKDRKAGIHKITCKMVREGGDFDDIQFMWSDEEKGFTLISEELKNILNENKTDKKTMLTKQTIILAFGQSKECEHITLRNKVIGNDPNIKATAADATKQKAALRVIEKALESGFIEKKENGKQIIYTLLTA